MGRISKSNILLTCGLAFFGAAFAFGAAFTINSANNQAYEEVHAEPEQAPVSYIARSWDGTKVVESEEVCTEYTEITGKVETLSSGWYVVKKNITTYNDTRITCTGTVNLILSDNVVFRMTKGISTTNATLNIYGQENNSGLLHISNCDDGCAAIGGAKDNSGGTFNFHGGSLWAHGGFYAAAIGSGQNNTSSTIRSGEVTIYGGTVYTETYSYGAAIGGGEKKGSGNITVDPVKIYGGNVTALGSTSANGIGAGKGYTNNGELTVASGLNVLNLGYSQTPEIITDYATTRYQRMRVCAPISYVSRSWDDTNKVVVESTVNCISYTNASAFQEQYMSGDTYVVDSNFTTTLDYITVYNTCNLILFDGCSWAPKKGIYVSGSSGSSGTLNIYGQSNDTGILIAGDGMQSSDMTGIGGRGYNNSGNINIYGGTIKATGSKDSAGIGGQFVLDTTYSIGDLTIYGGNITAKGGSDRFYGRAAAGIGCPAANPGKENVAFNVTIYGGSVNAIGGEYGGAGIGGGYTDGYLTTGPASGYGGTVTIKGGTVRASGGNGAMGIGAGRGGTNNGTLSVDNTLDVYGGDSKNPGTLINDCATNRTRYMVAKAHAGKIDLVCTEPTYVGAAADQVLNTIPLPDGWSWKTPTAVVGDGIGFEMTNVPSNTDVYNTLEKTIDITVVEPVSYIDKEWNSTTKQVVKTNKTCTTYRAVSEDIETTWTAGWYVVNSNVTLPSRITVEGTVNLILKDGCSLTVNDGISVALDDTINIYSQSDGDNVGKLIAITDGRNIRHSPLGGPDYDHSGIINIYGGDITAKNINSDTGDSYGAAAIGGGSDGSSGPITIYGGKITATAGDAGAGIGGGSLGSYYGPRSVGAITIYDGTVVATGGIGAAGIGAGSCRGAYSDKNLAASFDVAPIRIYGGNITATGGASSASSPAYLASYTGGAGIGCGYIYAVNNTLYCSVTINEVTINGGTVTAQGGNQSAGIGAGPTNGLATISNITINGGTVTATGYSYSDGKGGAGIGSGYANTSYSSYPLKTVISSITINGGTVTATGDDGPGIGLANCSNDSSFGTLTVNGGRVTATGSSEYDGIGCTTGTAKKGTLSIGTNVGVFGDATENPETQRTKTEYDAGRWQYMIVKSLHEHNWSYALDGTSSIVATCNGTGGACPETPSSLTLTMSEPTNLSYDGTAKAVVFNDGFSEAAFGTPNPTYYSYYDEAWHELTGAPTNVGQYKAEVTYGGQTAVVEYTVVKSDPIYTAPTEIDLTYTGSAQELVNAGTTTDGTIYYKLGTDGEYSTDIPTATDASTYDVYYKIIGDANHNDLVIDEPIQATIAKADVTLTAPTGIISAHDEQSHALINAGSVTGGEFQYKVGDGEWSTAIPTATDIGDYYVYYKVIGDANHNNVAETAVSPTPAINKSVATVSDGTTTSYYDSFAGAISDWGDGTTLTLLDDVTTSNQINISNTRTLDLNGYGIRATGSNYHIFYISNNGNLTVNDSNPNRSHKIQLDGYHGIHVDDDCTTENPVENGTGIVNITGGYITGGYSTSSSVKEGIAFYVEGGTLILNNGTIIGNYIDVTNCAGAGVWLMNGATLKMYDGAAFIYNYASNSAAAIENTGSNLEIYGGTIAYNKNNNGGGSAISATGASTVRLYGGRIEDNISRSAEGAVDFYRWDGSSNPKQNQKIYIKGSPVVQNNTTVASGNAKNMRLYSKLRLEGELTNTDKIGVLLNGAGADNDWSNGKGIFTTGWSTYMAGEDPADYFFSDNPNYIIYLKNGEACCGVPYTVTYDANGHGTAPNPMVVGDGALINEPTAPTAQDWDFGGWYKEDTCETLWDFASDTVTADTTLYAGWKNSYEITAPTAITGLKYTGSNHNLINAGTTEAGEMQYAVNTTGVLPADGDFANTIPTGKLVGKYYVFYRTTGDADHYPVPASLDKVVEITIARVDRTKITTLNQEVIEFLDSIKDDDRLDDVRAALEGVRNEVANDAIIEDNIDEAGVEENYLKLKEAFDYHKQTVDAVKAIDDIGDLTYDGGIDDSQDDIIAAKKAYDALKPEQQEVVNNANKDVLDHDILVYKHVDKVGDLIKAIPEPSDSDDYYDAIDLAKAEFDKLTDEEKAVLNTDTKFDYEKALKDHLKAKEVIEVISKMDDVTYNGGTDDSKDEIENAEKAYNDLTPEQKELVNKANHDELEDKRETYDNVDDTVKKIANIGDINHGGDKDSKKDIDDARKAYDSLSEEEKALVGGYNNSTQTLEDGEAVYEVMKLIDSIGDIAYDTVPEKAIEEARQTYQSLTEAQKEKLGKEYYEVLVKSEEQYEEAKKTGDILLLVLMIVLGLLLVAGLIFMFILLKKKKDDDDDNKKEPLKVASVSGLLPIIFLSHYLDAPYIILYVIAALTVIVWTIDIIIAVKKKGQKKVVTAQEVRKVEETQPASKEEEEVVTVTDEKGNIFQIRFIKSFTAKLIQSPDETKKYYEELKNEVLSYKKTNSRVSWHYDSVNSGRNQVLKFAVRGKTLCVYYPLNADDYTDTKYKVEKSESKKYEEVPCMYRIKNERRLGYAKDLIAVVASNLGLVKGEEQHEVYSNLPYEPNKPLIERGLIKEQKIQVNKPVEQPVPEPVNEDEDEVITLADEKGNIFQIRFVKSFTAKLIQSPDETKKYYEELKNYVLSYKKTTSRISWNYDSINSGRNQVLKFSIRGKTLCVYYPLNADDYAESKYKVEKVESKKFEEVPCLYRIKNDRRRDYAKDLIDTVMANLGLEKGEEQYEVYSNLPYEPNKPLIARGLIKELKVQVNKPAEPQVLESKTNADGDEVVITKDASGNIFEIRYIKSFTAKLSQGSDELKDYYSELKNYALSYKKANSRVSWHYDSINVGRNQILKFAIRGKTLCLYYALDADQYIDTKYKVEKVESKKYEDVPCLYRIKNDRRRDYAKDLIDTVMANVGSSKGEEQNEDYRIPFEETKVLLGKGLIKEVKTKVNKPEEVVLESVSVTEVDQKMSDEVAEAKIIEDTTSKKHEGKKGIINIDTIGDNFSDGDNVDIEALWKKKLIPSNVGYVKVLARGSLNKKLTVNLQDYSIQAVKMILLSGGNVKKAK